MRADDEVLLPGVRDEEAEASLAEGAAPEGLVTLFGRGLLESLKDLAARAAGVAEAGPRVLLLPGTLGSRLGYKGRLLDDNVWLDPLDVRRGRLVELAHDEAGESPTELLGVLLAAYLLPKLWLQARGYRVEFWPYDWRRGVAALGADLAAHLATLEGEVQLVCHSYGGLVARAALARGGDAVTRVVTLGTPHAGSWATLMILRGNHPVIQRLAALTPEADPHRLASELFGSFAGTYSLLPPEAPGFDLFDPGAWPREGPRPDPRLLDQARRELEALPPPDERFRAVAGYGLDTPQGATPGEHGFAYTLGDAGDGVVPVASAAPTGCPAWVVHASHGGLPVNPEVLAALPELLEAGESSRLAAEAPPQTMREDVTDADLDGDYPAVREALLTPSRDTLRALAFEFVRPAPPDPPEPSEGRGRDERYRLLQAHGEDPNDYATLQPDLEYHDHPAGFLAYRRSAFRPVVLGDPVVAAGERPALLREFLAAHPRAVFFNASQGMAADLLALGEGHRACPMGSERWLDLGSGTWAEQKKVKGALKKAKKGKLELEELELAELPPERRELLEAVNREFLEATPSGKEITFVSRPVALRPEPGVRVFMLSCVELGSRRDFGFLVLDPWYSGGRCVGYQLNAIRFRRTKIWGVYLAVAARLAAQLAEEGLERFSVGGLAYDLVDEPSPFPHDERMRRRLEQVRERTDEYYVMSHFTEMKLALAGVPLRRYIVIPRSASVTRSVLRFLRVSGMF